MRYIQRLLLYILLIAGVVRMALFLAYAALELPSPLETYYLEAKMVHLAWRVQHGLSLYPDWRSYPHVANFYGPCYFVAVGLLGRALGVGLDGLFLVGRAASLAAALLTTLVLGLYLGRRYGTGAAWAGAILSVGSAPMYGFAVMTRPDTTADLLGLAGFILALMPRRMPTLIGAGLLVSAVLTKQTAGAYLLAVALALLASGRWRRAVGVLLGCAIALGLVVLGLTLSFEPNFAAGLLGDAKTPGSVSYWLTIAGLLARLSPDLLLFPVLGLVLWNTGGRRDVGPTALAIVLLSVSLLTAAKHGSSLNYFLGLRIVEGLAVGALWHAVHEPGSRSRPGLTVALVLGFASLLPSTSYIGMGVQKAAQSRSLWDTSQGRAILSLYRQFFRDAADPDSRLLTDDGLIDVHRGEATIFGDPHLLRVLVETGQLDPKLLRERADRGYYDLVVTRRDLFSADYETYEFGLPMPVVEGLRARYQPAGSQGSHFFYYTRRPEPPSRSDREADQEPSHTP